MAGMGNAAYLDGTGSLDINNNWQLASSTNPLPVTVVQATSDAFTTELDYNGGTNITYVGLAVPGTATSAAAWQIAFLTYDGNNNILTKTYAGGSGSFTNVWNNRASYSYS